MSRFRCAFCNTPIRVTNWDLVPASFPSVYRCVACGSSNMFSRATLLLGVVPSVMGVLAFAQAFQQGLVGINPVLGVAAGYVMGIPIGVALGRSYGRLGPPLRPLF